MELFSNWNIGKLQMANRLVRSATFEGLARQDGEATPQLARAMGQLSNVGLIISGCAYVAPEGRIAPSQTGIHNQHMLAGLSRMAAAVHKNRGKIVAQISHAGGQTSSQVIGQQPMGPSKVFNPLFQHWVEPMSRSQIEDLIEKFARAARRAQEAGFDGVQLHMAHGYLIHQFLNPWANQRQDVYGQPHLFALQVVQQVRQEVGPDYPLLVKINSEDSHEGMQTLEHALALAPALAVDAIEVSGGVRMGADFASSQLSPSRQTGEGYFFANAARIKALVKCPVISVGGWRSQEQVASALTQVDAVAMCRPFIRQPNLAQLWEKGEDARCLSCDQCYPLIAKQGLLCALDNNRA